MNFSEVENSNLRGRRYVRAFHIALRSAVKHLADLSLRRNERKHTGRAILLGSAIILLATGAGTLSLLDRMRAASLKSAELAGENVAVVLETALNRQFLQVDGALLSLPSLISMASDSKAVDAAMASRLLRGFNFQTFILRDLILANSDGSIVAQARPGLPGHKLPLAIGSDDFAKNAGGVIVAGPARNPATGDISIYLARPSNLPGLGNVYAVAEVPVQLIDVLLSPSTQLSGIHINIFRSDGRVLATLPRNDSALILPHDLLQSTPPDGVARLPSATQDRPAIIRVVRATLYPDILVGVDIPVATALANSSREKNQIITVGLAISAVVMAFATALYTTFKQQAKVELERFRASQMLHNAIDSMSDGFVMWDENDRLITCNKRYREIYHVSAPFLTAGTHFADIIREGALRGQYKEANATTGVEDFVAQIVKWHRSDSGFLERELPDGRWIQITERRTLDNGVVGIRTDITALKRAASDLALANMKVEVALAELREHNSQLQERDETLQRQNLLFEAALNNMSQGLLMTDVTQNLIVCNRRFLDMFGMGGLAVEPGLSIATVFAAIEQAGKIPADLVRYVFHQQRALALNGEGQSFVTTDETSPVLAVSQRPMQGGGWVATYEDVTKQHMAAQQIRFIAHHDPLTKLPNRVLFRIRIDEALRAPKTRGTGLALLYLDLDNFKDINDTLGHPAGDALLSMAGNRLLSCLRSSDFAARLGGDEFAVIYVAENMPYAAQAIGKRIIEVLSSPYELMGRMVTVGVSVGIAMAKYAEVTADVLLKNADLALYQAKATGRGTTCLFESDMDARLNARIALESDLRAALSADQFELLYQPLYNLRQDRVCGFEALLRWHHPLRGLVMPMKFISMAEEIGVIRAIGAWVIRKACNDAALLPDDIGIAVNLSPAQLRDNDIVDIVQDALASSGLAPTRLELEITETALLKNNELTVSLLTRLHRLGINIALDDFGTGYSSLSYLRSFPFDKIKIDQSFVREMGSRVDCAAIVSSVSSLAAKLGMRTTAEGIETVEQLASIREMGCDEAQGYLFGVPRPISDVQEFFRKSDVSQCLAP